MRISFDGCLYHAILHEILCAGFRKLHGFFPWFLTRITCMLYLQKSFLNYPLVIPEFRNILGRRDLMSVIPEI